MASGTYLSSVEFPRTALSTPWDSLDSHVSPLSLPCMGRDMDKLSSSSGHYPSVYIEQAPDSDPCLNGLWSHFLLYLHRVPASQRLSVVSTYCMLPPSRQEPRVGSLQMQVCLWTLSPSAELACCPGLSLVQLRGLSEWGLLVLFYNCY